MDKPSATSGSGSDKRVMFKKPRKCPSKDKTMQAMFATATMHNMASTYFKGKQPKKDIVLTEELNNLNLEKDASSSDSDSSSSKEE